MGRFPQNFVEELKTHADIVQVIQDTVPLKRAGSSYKGLCPFHTEKTPSFHVNRDKGFFHCFGCGTGGDVVKFMELQEKLTFPEAIRQLAQRFGLQVPESDDPASDAAADAQREALLKVHAMAATYFREQLGQAGGGRAAEQLKARGILPETIEQLGLGYAPPQREGLKRYLLEAGQPQDSSVDQRAGCRPWSGADHRSFPKPADDSDLPRQWVDHRVRRAGARIRSATQVRELPGDRAVQQGPDALWPSSHEDGDPAVGLRGDG